MLEQLVVAELLAQSDRPAGPSARRAARPARPAGRPAARPAAVVALRRAGGRAVALGGPRRAGVQRARRDLHPARGAGGPGHGVRGGRQLRAEPAAAVHHVARRPAPGRRRAGRRRGRGWGSPQPATGPDAGARAWCDGQISGSVRVGVAWAPSCSRPDRLHALRGQRAPVLAEPLLGVVLRGEHRADRAVERGPVRRRRSATPTAAAPPSRDRLAPGRTTQRLVGRERAGDPRRRRTDPRRSGRCSPAPASRRRRRTRGRRPAVVMPPTPMITASGPEAVAQPGHHVEPAGEHAAGRTARRARGRAPMVVLTATIPSRPSSAASSATASTSSSDRSGAILTSSGTRASPAAAVASSAATRVASRIGRSASTDCRSRRPGVFGRGHVDHQVVGVRREPAGARRVVGGGVLGGGDLGLADVHADHEPAARRGRAQPPQPRRRRPRSPRC